jgi:hypothetical protein
VDDGEGLCVEWHLIWKSIRSWRNESLRKAIDLISHVGMLDCRELIRIDVSASRRADPLVRLYSFRQLLSRPMTSLSWPVTSIHGSNSAQLTRARDAARVWRYRDV